MAAMAMARRPAGGTTPVRGLSLEQDGLILSPVSVPDETGEAGTLSFSITSADGTAVTEFETEHDKELHLIVVRADGAQFRHVHPKMSDDGVWSIPWTWDEAGTTGCSPTSSPTATGENLTLSRTVDVAGRFSPEPVTIRIGRRLGRRLHRHARGRPERERGLDARRDHLEGRRAGHRSGAVPRRLRASRRAARRRPGLPARAPRGRRAGARVGVRSGHHVHDEAPTLGPVPAVPRLQGRREGAHGALRPGHDDGEVRYRGPRPTSLPDDSGHGH